MIVSNTSQLKKINQERIRQAIKDNPNSTKAVIAQETGLSLATCNNILNEMLGIGEITVAEMAPSSGGRPATQFVYNKDYQYAICMYVGNEGHAKTLAYVVVNAVGEVLEQLRTPMALLNADVIENQIAALLVHYPKVMAIGIGVPGEVQDGLIDLCDVKELENVDLRERLLRKFNCEIIVENDMDFITYGHYMEYMDVRGSESKRNLAVIYFSKDNLPGCGVVIDDRLLKGSTMFAGELSYISAAYGINREQQAERLNNPLEFPDIAAKSIVAVISTINPQTIVLLGEQLKGVDVQAIEERCAQVIPQKHMPRIIVSDEIHEYYIRGLIQITTQSLIYGIPTLQKGV